MASSSTSRLRTSPFVWDVALMLLLSPFTLLVPLSIGYELRAMFALPIGLGMTIPLAFRRSRPEQAAAAVVVAHLIQVMATSTQLPGNITAPIALYAAVRYGRRDHARMWLAVAAIGSLAGGVRWGLWQSGYSGIVTPTSLVIGVFMWTIVNLGVMTAVWFSAQWSRQREDNLASLQQRAEALERERDKAMALVAEEERSRIAREMHDIVAHSLSVIVVQSDGANYLAQHSEIGDPEARLAQVGKAIETINQTARQALGETRRLVGVLRHGDDGAELAPAAGLAQIDELVENLRNANYVTSVVRRGTPTAHPPLTAGAEMACYRVVQESLTNVMKHAGPGASVVVEIVNDVDGVHLRVTDDGCGQTATDGNGHGLIGMRERMAAYGGTLIARPRLDCGFEVIAHLPVPPARTTPTYTRPNPARTNR